MATPKHWTPRARRLAAARVTARFWTCPACERQSLAKWAYRDRRMVRVCRFCGADDRAKTTA
jgi:transcription elongation factor Elf1